MTDINPIAEAAREIARRDTGRFGKQEHSAPEAALNPRAELDAVNELYQSCSEHIQEEVVLYLQHGMPATADRVEFIPSDQGDYLTVDRAFDKDGVQIETEEDFDRWADVDEIVALLGHPDDNREIREILHDEEDGRYSWARTSETNDADELTIRERIDALTATQRRLGQESQAAAIVAARRLLPEGSTLHLTWGDQDGPDYLSAEKIVLVDGTVLDSEAAYDAGIDWDELDMVASDIRNTSDHSISHLDDRGFMFALRQEPMHVPYPGEEFDPAHSHDWADGACHELNCAARLP